jgi:hypothetical protein
MRDATPPEPIETLLTREGRAALPLRRQLRLYLDPFALFKDASCGSARARALALSYNRARRVFLLTYVKRWLLIAGVLFVGIGPAEALAARMPGLFAAAAVLGIGCAIALAVAARAAAVYLMLGQR